MVHIFTHNDLDGYAAGYVVLQALGENGCKITHLNYDKEPVLEEVKNGDTVVITDYSFTNDQYRQLLDFVGPNGKVIWCDHHITAINRYLDDADELNLFGLRSTKYCGAVLAWLYFNGYTLDDINTIPYDNLMNRLPLYLCLVDSWDTWKLDVPYRHNAEALNIAVSGKLSIDLIRSLEDVKTLYDYIEAGEKYIEYRDIFAAQYRKSYLFSVEISGKYFGVDRNIKIAIMNIGCANSTFFGEEIDNYDVCSTICFNGKQLAVSFYSAKDDIDCSMAAKHIGGGGHKSAAGVVIDMGTDDPQKIIKMFKGED